MSNNPLDPKDIPRTGESKATGTDKSTPGKNQPGKNTAEMSGSGETGVDSQLASGQNTASTTAQQPAKTEVTSSASEQPETGNLHEELGETRRTFKSQAQDTLSQFKESARHEAEAQAAQGRQEATSELNNLAGVFRRVADDVEGQSRLPLDAYIRAGAQQLDSLAQSIEGANFGTMVRKLEEQTRQRPALVIGGAIATGFLLTRFLKASARADTGQTTQPAGNRAMSRPEPGSAVSPRTTH